MLDIQLEGVEEVLEALQRWEDEVIQVLIQSINKSGEHLLGVAMDLTPKLTGDLEGSGTMDPVQVIPGQISVEVGFHKVYALRRHEEVYNLGPISRGKPPVDGMQVGRKYLERPLLKYSKRYPQDWADAIRGITGAG